MVKRSLYMAKTEAAPATKAMTATEDASFSAELELGATEEELEAEAPVALAAPLEAAEAAKVGMEEAPETAEEAAEGTTEVPAVLIEPDAALAAALLEVAAPETAGLAEVESFC
jgi:hypothetical protein